jgi:hypothetical protein
MKKAVKLILVVSLIFSSIIISCKKDNSTETIVSSEQVFENLLSTNLKQLKQLENDALIMSKNGNKYDITFEKGLLTFFFDPAPSSNKNAKITGCSKPVGTEVCTGDGVSFARCSKGYLDGGCSLAIWKGKDGNYHAKVIQL